MRVGLLLSAGLLFSCPALALQVTNVRVWPAPDHTRVVFDVDGAVEHSVFMLENPERVVIDLRDTTLNKRIGRPSRSDKLLGRVRSAQRPGGDLRVVLDLKKAARPRSFLLKPNNKYGHRLVVDLFARDENGTDQPRVVKRVEPSGGEPRDIVVAIDAGHGGEDPGAVGPGGTREKTVTLAVARELAAAFRRERGIEPVLVRSGDYYIGLRRRMEVARAHRADLFVSIHADSFTDPRVRGTAVYVLSRNGASSEAARWLAEQENAADLVGGISLDDKDELLASVLLDLSQTATMSASTEVGAKVLRELNSLGKLHKRQVERAGFMVLKSPDIPSMLVETAFITNPDEERRLNDARYRRRMADSIARGVKGFFERNPPPGTLLAARRHVIARGDTLSGIAARYQISLNDLRSANSISNNRIRIGEVLTIPSSGS